MNRKIRVPAALLVCMLLFGACKSKQQSIKTVPIREMTTVELEPIELKADSVSVRVPFEQLLTGTQTGGVAVSAHGLRLLWELRRGMLHIRADKPPDQLHIPHTTTIKEVPVEVIQEKPVNRLHPGQKGLMYVGIIGLIGFLLQLCKLSLRWVAVK